jgi:hypothetical protein
MCAQNCLRACVVLSGYARNQHTPPPLPFAGGWSSEHVCSDCACNKPVLGTPMRVSSVLSSATYQG